MYYFSSIRYIHPMQRWNRSGFSQPAPTGKFQNLRRSTVFFYRRFCSLSNAFNEHFSEGGAWVMYWNLWLRTDAELQTGRLVRARNRPKPGNISPNPKTNLKPKSCRKKKTKLKLGLKNYAMFPNNVDYIFVLPSKKVRFKPELSPNLCQL